MCQSFFIWKDRPSARMIARAVCLATVTLYILQQAGCAKKTIHPGKIVGSSMAPNVLGDHYLANCSRCEFEFPCEVEQSDRRDFLVCPNCGFEKVDRSTLPIQPAQQVEIDFQTKVFDRWDLVAFHQPETDDAGVKRIVGLPGETLEILNGNLFKDGQLLQKEIETQKSMRIMVHDSKFTAQDDQRWVPLDDSSNWTTGNHGEIFFRRRDSSIEIDWISYRQRKCYSHRDSSSQPVAVEDNYGFNQSISRDLNSTDELYLEVDLELTPDSVFGWRFDCRGKLYEFFLDVETSTLSFQHPDETGNSRMFSIPAAIFKDGAVRLEFSTIDHRLIVLLDNHRLPAIGYQPANGPVSVSPLALCGRDGVITATRIRIWRDIYYSGRSTTERAGSPIGDDTCGYIVLGDNVPISVDSRYWSPASLAKTSIIGKVKIGSNR